jgi:colanic acid/amylovoran biosynthesis protein
LKKLASAIFNLRDRVPALRVSVFPQVDVGGNDSDVGVSRRLVELLGDGLAEYVDVLDECGPEDMMDLYGAMDLFLASRMHSAILALDTGIPVIALSYQPKSRGTFDLLGLGRYVVDVETFETSYLVEVMLDALGPSGAKFRYAAGGAKERLREGLRETLTRDAA